MALVQPKRPVGGAYGIFLTEKRPGLLSQCVGQKASAIAKLASEAWGKLSEKQKVPYQKKYEAAKKQFDEDMVAFLAAGGVKEKGLLAQRSQKRKEKGRPLRTTKDPNAPKRPCGGGFGVYLAEKREKIMKQLPSGYKFADVTKTAGAEWKALSAASKKPFEAKYQKKMAEYKAAIEEYRKTHGVDEAEDGDEDEEDGEDDDDEKEQQLPTKKLRKGGA